MRLSSIVSQLFAGQEQVVATRRTPLITTLALDRVEAPLLVCDESGIVVGASEPGKALLGRAGTSLAALPTALPRELWELVATQTDRDVVQWRPAGERDFMLGCTRFRAGSEWLLILNDISQQQSALASRLHQQRLETLGRVVANVVHDLRAPLSSIVFGIDVLACRAGELSADRAREIVSDVRTASFCLRETIDCLLDFLRLGPPAPSEVSIKNVLGRTQSLLRPQLRLGPHELVVSVDHDVLVSGNLLTIEQIFVNLVVNSLEAATAPTTVRLSTSLQDHRLRVLVEDNGPGIRAEHRHLVFEPMFTTKEHGVGLGLTAARESARSVGGDIQLVRWTGGTAFAVYLPMCAEQEGA